MGFKDKLRTWKREKQERRTRDIKEKRERIGKEIGRDIAAAKEESGLARAVEKQRSVKAERVKIKRRITGDRGKAFGGVYKDIRSGMGTVAGGIRSFARGVAPGPIDVMGTGSYGPSRAAPRRVRAKTTYKKVKGKYVPVRKSKGRRRRPAATRQRESPYVDIMGL